MFWADGAHFPASEPVIAVARGQIVGLNPIAQEHLHGNSSNLAQPFTWAQG